MGNYHVGFGERVVGFKRPTNSTPLLRIGAIFAIFGGFCHWFPLFTGLTLNEDWAKAHFFAIFFGVNLTFFPQHFLGLAGMPRRYSDYPDAYTKWNTVSSIGSIVSIVAILGFIFVIWEALVSQRAVIASAHLTPHTEWHDELPLDFHNLPEASSGTTAYPFYEINWLIIWRLQPKKRTL